MRSWLREFGLLLTASGALCMAAGCQSGGNNDMLEREIRWKEDRIYHLQDHVADYKKRLDSAQRENDTLRRDLEAAQGGGAAAPWNPGGSSIPIAPPSGSGPAGLPPVGSSGTDASLDNEPIISPPGEGLPEGIEVRSGTPAPPNETLSPTTEEPFPPAETLPDYGPASDGGGLLSPPDSSFDETLPDDAPAAGLPFGPGPDEMTSEDAGEYDGGPRVGNSYDDLPADTTYSLPVGVDQVVEVTLNELLTGGHDTSDALGDEGVLVVIEPRNTAGEIVDVAGTVDIAIVDPQLSGSDREVARWTFAPGEAADRFRETILGAGMHFDLPWPHRPPQNETLKLHVRYTTLEGEQFTLDEEIEIDPPALGAAASQPTAADTRARLLPPRAVDVPRSQANSRQRMARFGRPRFYPSDQQQQSSDTRRPTSSTPRRDEAQLAPPAWTPYR